jgi:hypothetical protein
MERLRHLRQEAVGMHGQHHLRRQVFHNLHQPKTAGRGRGLGVLYRPLDGQAVLTSSLCGGIHLSHLSHARTRQRGGGRLIQNLISQQWHGNLIYF